MVKYDDDAYFRKSCKKLKKKTAIFEVILIKFWQILWKIVHIYLTLQTNDQTFSFMAMLLRIIKLSEQTPDCLRNFCNTQKNITLSLPLQEETQFVFLNFSSISFFPKVKLLLKMKPLLFCFLSRTGNKTASNECLLL